MDYLLHKNVKRPCYKKLCESYKWSLMDRHIYTLNGIQSLIITQSAILINLQMFLQIHPLTRVNSSTISNLGDINIFAKLFEGKV